MHQYNVDVQITPFFICTRAPNRYVFHKSRLSWLHRCVISEYIAQQCNTFPQQCRHRSERNAQAGRAAMRRVARRNACTILTVAPAPPTHRHTAPDPGQGWPKICQSCHQSQKLFLNRYAPIFPWNILSILSDRFMIVESILARITDL